MALAVAVAELPVEYAIGSITTMPRPTIAAVNTTQSTVTAPVSLKQNLNSRLSIRFVLSGIKEAASSLSYLQLVWLKNVARFGTEVV